jgi:hypothetical protein
MGYLTDSYYLTQIGCIWGFGLWKRSWLLYDYYCNDFLYFKKKNYDNFLFSNKYKYYLNNYLELIRKEKLKTWDIQINYIAAKNKMYFIAPRVNLVNNIGFSAASTSAFISNYYYPTQKIIPIIHPKRLKYKAINDIIYFNNLLKGGYLRIFLINIYFYLPKFVREVIKKIINFIKYHKNESNTNNRICNKSLE